MLDAPIPSQVALRDPDTVMRLSRMGSMFPTRLSFLRSLMRRLSAENVTVTREVWQMCAQGYGHGVFSITLGGHTYSLVAVSTDLPPELRTDRVIATAWDSAYVLYDGVPDAAEVARIVAAVPHQEASRFTPRDLILSRANKSVRLFDHVVSALRAGRQPDVQMIRDVGYLMRTTAVYGNGKFGIADRDAIDTRPGLEGPFAAEMLTVWLIRHFTHALAEHVGGMALDPALKRHLGIGNSTGLGMAPFLVTHPVLLNNWMLVRETALARVRALATLDDTQQARLMALTTRAAQHLREWNVPDPQHQARIAALRDAWDAVCATLDFSVPHAIDHAMQSVAGHSEDVQELMVSLLIEPFGELVDGLADCMGDPFGPFAAPIRDCSDLRATIESDFGWALRPDYDETDACAQFWYVSEAKQEPRLGDRHREPGADLESPLDTGRRIKALHMALADVQGGVCDFIQAQPQHMFALARVEMGARYPYAEIRDNLIARDCLPIDMLRCKLSFFGASKFDPKSDRWTRITLCQGAPLAGDLANGADDWWLPVFAA